MLNFTMRRRHFIRAATSAAAALLAARLLPTLAQAQTIAPAKTAVPDASRTLLVVGDSLSAEYGLVRGQGWVALLDKRLQKQASGWTVVNASISGDTTSGGAARLPQLLQKHGPRVVILELGGNDALRGLPLQSTQDNLRKMVSVSKASGAKVLLLGIQVPPNYGQRYGKNFAALFTSVANEEKIPVLPFLLSGIAEGPDAGTLFQADRIHPTAQAHPRMLDNVWPLLKPLLK